MIIILTRSVPVWAAWSDNDLAATRPHSSQFVSRNLNPSHPVSRRLTPAMARVPAGPRHAGSPED